MRSFRYAAVAALTLYVACADPPKKFLPGAGGKGGAATTGGSQSSGASDSGATGGVPDEAGGQGGSGPVTADAGAPSASGGEAGASSALGDGGAGGAPPAPVDPCATAEVGVSSSLPVPQDTGVAKPDGAVGNLKIENWAGFKGAISFTFDDALQSQITHYDALNAVGVPMTFYLVGANDGSKPIWTTAAEDGHELGNHTMHHCYANGTQCGWGNFTNIDDELDVCTAHIESAFGVPAVYSFASPMGDNNWIDPASQRFLVARGVYDNPSGIAPNDATNPFNLPCHIAAENETAAAGFDLVTDSVRSKGIWRIILAHALTEKDGYNPIDASEMVSAMTYARDAGDVWVDTVTSIGAYWRGQKAVSSVTPTKNGSSRTYSWTLPDHFPPGQFLRVTVDGGKLTQCGTELTWDEHGYYEVALDAGSLTIAP